MDGWVQSWRGDINGEADSGREEDPSSSVIMSNSMTARFVCVCVCVICGYRCSRVCVCVRTVVFARAGG